MVIFDHAHPKIIESTFSFPEFVPAWKKWLYSICLFFSPVTRLVTPIFDHAHPKMFWSAFNFCDHVLICKKSVHIFHLFILQIQSILESHHQTSHIHFLAMLTHFWTNQLVPSDLSWDTVNFRVQRPDWPHSFLATPHQKLFNQLLIFVNFYQHAKNEAVSSIFSREILDLKILQSEWLRAFWAISQEQYFSQTEDLRSNIDFHYRMNSGKINDQIYL